MNLYIKTPAWATLLMQELLLSVMDTSLLCQLACRFTAILAIRGSQPDADTALVDLELAADVDHDESQTDVEERVGGALERSVGRSQQSGEQLGRHKAQHQEKREG